MEAPEDLQNAIVDYTYSFRHHEPFKNLPKDDLYYTLKNMKNRDEDEERMFQGVVKLRQSVENFNETIRATLKAKLDRATGIVKEMFVGKFVTYNYRNRDIESKDMDYIFVKDVEVGPWGGGTPHFLLKGPSVRITFGYRPQGHTMQFDPNRVVPFVPTTAPNANAVKEAVRNFTPVRYSTENDFLSRSKLLIDSIGKAYNEIRNTLVQIAHEDKHG